MLDKTQEFKAEGQEADQSAADTFLGKPVKQYMTGQFQPPLDNETRKQVTPNDNG